MITIYFYCTKSHPYHDLPGRIIHCLRGFVVAQCTASQFIRIPAALIAANKDQRNEFASTTAPSDRVDHSCVSWKELSDYSKGKDVYALYLDNVYSCHLDLMDFSSDKEGKRRIRRAPQSYCHAYRGSEECYIFSDHQKYCEKIDGLVKQIELRKELPKEGINNIKVLPSSMYEQPMRG